MRRAGCARISWRCRYGSAKSSGWPTPSRTASPGYGGEILFGEHHESHAASAFYPSPFEEAAVVTIDGVGEWATSSIGVGRGHDLELLMEQRFPHSLGLLYSAFTYFTGFKVNSGEYKVMGLAPYGEPKYVKAIKDHLVEIRDDGSLWMNMEYFTYRTVDDDRGGVRASVRRTGEAPESRLTQREMDLARSVQDITEEVMLKMAEYARQRTGLRDLCLAGGVALNCVGNGRILREGSSKRSGSSRPPAMRAAPLGVALNVWHRHLDQPRVEPRDRGHLAASVGVAGAQHTAAVRRRHERLVSRPALHARRDPAIPRRPRHRGTPVRASGARRARGGPAR